MLPFPLGSSLVYVVCLYDIMMVVLESRKETPKIKIFL